METNKTNNIADKPPHIVHGFEHRVPILAKGKQATTLGENPKATSFKHKLTC